MWSEQPACDSETIPSGNPHYQNTSAAALLSYDVGHAIPWDWRVSLYTWTKGIAAGAYLVAALLVLFGVLAADSALWLRVAPVLAGAFLALTGALLIWDLEHPERFYMIFTRPQWRSWLVKGAFIIAGYSLVLALHFLSGITTMTGGAQTVRWLIIAGLPLAALTAVYTAYLFAQAKARDLWQNPLLPPHLFVQSLLVGSAALVPFAHAFAPDAVSPLLRTLAASSLVHILMAWGEVTLTHPTAHARLAVREMTRGSYKIFYWLSLALSCAAVFAPWLDLASVPLALMGLLLYEHAYVQAGQSVPLA
jgi:formate-dependent nitrite reductase membrane component NrfD